MALVVAIALTFSCGGGKQAAPATSPQPSLVPGPAVGTGGLAYDEIGGEVVLVDPSGAGTWSWDGQHAWQQRHSSSTPTTLRGKMGGPAPAMAWDSVTGSILAVIGDYTNTLQLRGSPPATWSWRDGKWTKFDGVHTPGVASGAMAAFPPAHQLILFSGCCSVVQQPGCCVGQVATSGMWTWDGRDWSELHPAHMPPARWGAAIAYDPAMGRVVMFGGETQEPNKPPLTDLWTWDGTDWLQAAGPGVASDVVASMAGVPSGAIVLVVSGQPGFGPGETWTWDGTSWRHLGVTTPSCFFCELTYDPIRHRTVMVTNTQGRPDSAAEVWTWDGIVWTQRS